MMVSTKTTFLFRMGSIKNFLITLHSCGIGAEFTQCDWIAAYKHLRVRKEDVQLQFFYWLGMYFAELCLVFGAVSSAGLYDRLAKVVFYIAIVLSGIPPHLVCQYIDDVVGVPQQDQELLNGLIRPISKW